MGDAVADVIRYVEGPVCNRAGQGQLRLRR